MSVLACHIGLHFCARVSSCSGPSLAVFAMDEKSGAAKEGAGSGVVPLSLVNSFLSEQRRSLNARIETLKKIFPQNTKLITINEAVIIMAVSHIESVCRIL